MWQETRQNLSAGAFGDPQDIETLLLFWGKMEELHYPGANATKKFLEDRNARQQEAMQQAAQQEALQKQSPPEAGGNPQISGDMLAAIERQAQMDAMRDSGMTM